MTRNKDYLRALGLLDLARQRGDAVAIRDHEALLADAPDYIRRLADGDTSPVDALPEPPPLAPDAYARTRSQVMDALGLTPADLDPGGSVPETPPPSPWWVGLWDALPSLDNLLVALGDVGIWRDSSVALPAAIGGTGSATSHTQLSDDDLFEAQLDLLEELADGACRYGVRVVFRQDVPSSVVCVARVVGEGGDSPPVDVEVPLSRRGAGPTVGEVQVLVPAELKSPALRVKVFPREH